jgi:hypothetical protein
MPRVLGGNAEQTGGNLKILKRLSKPNFEPAPNRIRRVGQRIGCDNELVFSLAYNSHGLTHVAEEAVRHNFLEDTELFFFLLVAMTYIDAMIERGVFDELRNWLVARGFTSAFSDRSRAVV